MQHMCSDYKYMSPPSLPIHVDVPHTFPSFEKRFTPVKYIPCQCYLPSFRVIPNISDKILQPVDPFCRVLLPTVVVLGCLLVLPTLVVKYFRKL